MWYFTLLTVKINIKSSTNKHIFRIWIHVYYYGSLSDDGASVPKDLLITKANTESQSTPIWHCDLSTTVMKCYILLPKLIYIYNNTNSVLTQQFPGPQVSSNTAFFKHVLFIYLYLRRWQAFFLPYPARLHGPRTYAKN